MSENKKMSRRDLLKTMSVATGGFVAGSALSSCSFGGDSETAPAEAVPAEASGEEAAPAEAPQAAAPAAQSDEPIRVVGIFPLERLYRRRWRRDAQWGGHGH